MGDPGRLSPDDSDRFKQEKLRLVWSKGEGCLASFLKRDLLLERKQEENDQILRSEPLLPPYNTTVSSLLLGVGDSDMVAGPINIPLPY